MKILGFNYGFFPKTQTFVYQQVKGLAKNNDVSLLGFYYENENLFPLSVPKNLVKLNKNPVDRLLSLTFRKLSGVYNNLSPLTSFRVGKVLKNLRPDIIHAHFGPVALLILPLAKKYKIPMIVSFHGIDASPAFLKSAKYKKSLTSLFEYAERIIIVSPHMTETLGIANWKHKVSFIPYGIDTGYFSPVSTNGAGGESPIKILHSGRLVTKKGVPDLINSFLGLTSKHPNIQLSIIGEGDEYDHCKQLIDGHPAGSKVRLLGSVSQESVRQEMQSSDIFVLNSRIDEKGDMEGTPVSILEAMSCGLAVVSTYHAGIPYVITNLENGLLVKERDNAGFALALDSLISSNTLRKELGGNARKTICTSYTNDIMLDRLNLLFQ